MQGKLRTIGICAGVFVAMLLAVWLTIDFINGFKVAPAPAEAVEPGTHIIGQGDMTEEEARAMLDETAEKSRMTVSVAADIEKMNEYARVNFVVVYPNNGITERCVLEQNGKELWDSGPVAPGNEIEWADIPELEEGVAHVTVSAVNKDGEGTGNPVKLDVVVHKA